MPCFSLVVVLLFLQGQQQLFAYAFAAASSSAWTPPSVSLVTGSSGYVGRAIVRELIKRQKQPIEEEGSSSQQQIQLQPFHNILCLVRPSRLKEEQHYWKDYLCRIANTKSSESESESSVSELCRCRITVYPYDMLDGGSTLKAALEGAAAAMDEDDASSRNVCIYHVASVFGPTEDHAQTAHNNVQGTMDVVRTIANFQKKEETTIGCRLVLTSSMAAVRGTGQDPINHQFYTHHDWNTVSKVGDNWGSSYQWSKSESERQAWNLSKEFHVPMVSLCPSFIFGPPASSSSSESGGTIQKDKKESQKTTTSESYSLTLVRQWIMGKSPVQSRLFVDIRDAAMAHVEAGCQPPDIVVGNRYIVSTEKRIPSKEIADVLKQVILDKQNEDETSSHYAADRITHDSEFQGGAIPIGSQEVECVDRLLQDLKVSLRPVEETFQDMACVLLKKNE